MKTNEVKKVSKRTAQKLFNEGTMIFLQSSNIMFDNVWQHALSIDNRDSESFEKICNSYKYYNCDAQRGNYIHFYIIDK